MEKRRLRMGPIALFGRVQLSHARLVEFAGVWRSLVSLGDEEEGNGVKPVERLDLLRQP